MRGSELPLRRPKALVKERGRGYPWYFCGLRVAVVPGDFEPPQSATPEQHRTLALSLKGTVGSILLHRGKEPQASVLGSLLRSNTYPLVLPGWPFEELPEQRLNLKLAVQEPQ